MAKHFPQFHRDNFFPSVFILKMKIDYILSFSFYLSLSTDLYAFPFKEIYDVIRHEFPL